MIQIKKIEDYSLKGDGYDEKGDKVYIDETTIEYIQDGDCTQNRDNVQSLKMSAVNNGIARFIRLETGENGWSISDENDILELINDFKERSKL